MEFTLDNVQEYIKKVMQEKEDQLSKGKLKRVQEFTQKCEDLKCIQAIYEYIQQAELSEQEMANYDSDVQMQLEEFDQAWDDLYKLEQDRVKEAEQTLFDMHLYYKLQIVISQEMEDLQKRIQLNDMPKVKYSSEVLQKQAHYNKLIKAGHFAEADILQKQLEEQMKSEQIKWNKNIREKMENKLNQLTKKQISELQALQQKLQGQIQQFIINRNNQKQLLQSKYQIGRAELEAQYNSDIHKNNQILNKMISKIQQYL
ncbi:hypothetical protein pb186bvf_002545 [Paramecium bursaria]